MSRAKKKDFIICACTIISTFKLIEAERYTNNIIEVPKITLYVVFQYIHRRTLICTIIVYIIRIFSILFFLVNYFLNLSNKKTNNIIQIIR